ncbi:hypothetical protein BJF96_g9180 [Verticillium dahliae]|uniref:Uncharacterized protein n=1 Tax=Verticillium dahliae TaxID=27337 RepID=A0AA44WBJ3_VERDA|nr:hypothetical protein BJF96_g9180 [Verticillium dahliae]
MGNFLVSHALGLESVNPARKCQKTRRKGVGCRFWVEKTWFGLKVVSSSSGRISHVVLFQARDFRAQTRRFERGALENWRRIPRAPLPPSGSTTPLHHATRVKLSRAVVRIKLGRSLFDHQNIPIIQRDN